MTRLSSAEPKVPMARLGTVSVGALGFGCMGLSEFYGPAADRTAAAAILERALELGVGLFDTADMYGRGDNEHLLAPFLAAHAAERAAGRLKIATKCGIVRDEGDGYRRGIDNSAAYIQAACDASLRRLSVDHIDLYYIHRLDKAVDVADTMGVLARLVEQGKIGAVGLCEVSAATLRRACAVFPVSAVQSEYSLWTREVEQSVLPACRELGVGLVAYSPLGRGFLTGAVRGTDGLASDDFRRLSPRFQGDALDRNLRLVDQLEALARRHHASPGQVALAWLMAQGDDVVPIPGTKRLAYLEQNMAARDLCLSHDDLAWLDAAFPRDGAWGDRYPAEGMKGLDA